MWKEGESLRFTAAITRVNINRVMGLPYSKPSHIMWWKKNKLVTKQVLKDANLDPVPYAKDRLRTNFAKTVLESLPIGQTDVGDSIDFQAEAIVLTLPQWQTIRARLESLPALLKEEQHKVIKEMIDFCELTP